MRSELTVVGGGESDDWTRRPIRSGEEKENAEHVLTVILSNLQRERGSAEIFYVRARNLVAFATALFVAVQAAFVASLGRRVDGEALLDPSLQDWIAVSAGIGVVCLMIAVCVLATAVDRPRMHRATTGEELLDLWLDPKDSTEKSLPFLMVLLGKLSDEEAEIAKANRNRAVAGWWLTGFILGTIICALAELVLLYLAIR